MDCSYSGPILHDSSDYDRKEKSKRYNALRLENISKVVLSKCQSTFDYYTCDGCCSHKFNDPQIAIDSVSKLRQKIWNSNLISSRNKGRDVRNSIILGELLACRYKDDNGIYQLNFTINGVRVCKNFYFKSTGLHIKLFNRATNYATNKNTTKNDAYFDKLLQTPILSSFRGELESIIKNRPSQYPKTIKENTSLRDNIIAFLDVQFSKGVDFAPENNVDRYTHLSWNELHSIYRSRCSELFISAADYSLFCKVR